MKLLTDSGEELVVSKLQLSEDDILVIEGVPPEGDADRIEQCVREGFGIKNKVMILFEGMRLSVLQRSPVSCSRCDDPIRDGAPCTMVDGKIVCENCTGGSSSEERS